LSLLCFFEHLESSAVSGKAESSWVKGAKKVTPRQEKSYKDLTSAEEFKETEKFTFTAHRQLVAKATLQLLTSLKMFKFEQFHRIIECFGLEGNFRCHLAQSPCSEQGHLQLDQAAQSPIQPGLECFQGWGTYHLSGQPVTVFHHPHGKKFLPYIQSKSTLF